MFIQNSIAYGKIIIEIRWKIDFYIISIISQQNFALGTTVPQLCHIQNFVVITSLQDGWE